VRIQLHSGYPSSVGEAVVAVMERTEDRVYLGVTRRGVDEPELELAEGDVLQLEDVWRVVELPPLSEEPSTVPGQGGRDVVAVLEKVD
jgi:hypothetical protein